jgi:glycosyltransferase involved in cell wall biosynthesis
MLLSIAMMVKNEERNLPRLLASIRPLLDMNVQFVVVDTGSDDNTISIAQAAGAKVYEEPWSGNFSKHRNTSFRKCRGKWILALDADEQFVFDGDIKDLFVLLKKIPKEINTISVEVSDIRQGKNISRADSIRFFRQGSTVWHRAIHNWPEFSGKTIALPRCRIEHFGYDLTPEQAKAKAERSIAILEQDLDDPDNLFYLSQAYALFKKDNEKSLQYAKAYIDFKPQYFNPAIYYLLLTILLEKNDIESVSKYFQQAVEHVQNSPDIWWCGIQLGIKSKNANFIGNCAQQFLKHLQNLDDFKIKWPGSFLFTNEKTYVAQALYYMAMNHFEHGSNALMQLEKLDLPQKSRQEISNKINDCFDKLGVTSKHQPQSRIIRIANVG